MRLFLYVILGALTALMFQAATQSSVLKTPAMVTVEKGEIPPPAGVSIEDEYPNSRYVRVTVHFDRHPDVVVSIPRKDMDSDDNIDYIIKKLEMRFKREKAR